MYIAANFSHIYCPSAKIISLVKAFNRQVFKEIIDFRQSSILSEKFQLLSE